MPRIIRLPLKVLSLWGLFSLLLISHTLARKCPKAEIYYHFLMAEEKIDQNQLKSAAKDLERVIACDPKAVYPRKELMKIYAQEGKYQKAITLAQEILKHAPKDKETRFILGKLYLAQGRPARAAETLENLLEEDPSYEEALSLLTMIYLHQKKIDQALEVIERLRVQHPKVPVLWLELARLYRQKGDFKRAREAYQKALALKPDSVQWTLEYGEFLEKLGEVKEAEKLYQDYLKRNPENFHLQEALLRLFIRQNRYEEALQVVEEMEKKVGQQPQLEIRKASILLNLKRDREAEEILRQLLLEHPENDMARFYLGVALERQGRGEEAIYQYESIPPSSDVFRLAVRRLAVLVKDPSELKALLERALEQYPDDKELYALAGSVFEDLDRCDLGYEFIKRGLEEFPDDEQLLLSEGFLLVCLGQEKKALEIVESLLAKDPNNPTILNFVGYTYADLNQELDKAEKLIKKALKFKPNDGYILDSLAWVYYRKGQYQKALEIIQKALKRISDDPIIYEHYGDILKALGQEKEAVEAYQKALKYVKKKRDRERLEKKIKVLCANSPSSS